ncbi:MAG: GHKL domain-containing protein, partial [Clostridia bacterium]|nr:GHKL domain-containing protein [Clostridia bacterium]
NDIVQQYSMGDYNARIPISGTEETIQLALSFNNMADQLEDLEATRQSFVANVSHELRSPLTSMKGFLEAMHDGTIVKEEYDQYIDIVLTETKRMASMVNDLLDLARIESGKSVLKLEVFDINELIRRILITFEARIYERKMDVEIRFAQEQFYVEADSTQISQVIRNLIDNAIKYSPENSKLRIATYAMRKEVYISIQDFGQGIPEEDVPRVFDRFYKVEKAHTPSKQSGTGLGLSIVKRIIDQHGQKITLKSARGKGSTFTFTLKRAPVPKRTQQDQNGGMIHEQY